MLRGVDHVAMAVSDLEAAIDHYERVWGLTLTHREVVPEQGVEEAMFRLGDTHLQLVAPLSPETPVGRFIERRGEGLHHIAYRVDEIEAALASARENRLMLVDDSPRRGTPGRWPPWPPPATSPTAGPARRARTSSPRR